VLQGLSGEETTGASNFSVAADGTLVYVAGVGGEAERQLAWIDASGQPVPLAAPARMYFEPALSPDGRYVAVDVTTATDTDVWLFDQERGTLSRLTFGPNCYAPIWSGDGRRVIYRKDTADGRFQIAWKLADGTGEEEVLFSGDRPVTPRSASSDGKWILFGMADPRNQRDLYVLPLDGDRTPQPYVTAPDDEGVAVFSPDGRWVAYCSNETGRYEVYVKPFPSASGRWQISTDGAGEVRWSSSGREIVFSTNRFFTAVPVETHGETFRAGPPRAFLTMPQSPVKAASGAGFALSLDGQRILTPYRPELDAQSPELVVLVNGANEVGKDDASTK
jgi:Tol biopolymer transport system component